MDDAKEADPIRNQRERSKHRGDARNQRCGHGPGDVRAGKLRSPAAQAEQERRQPHREVEDRVDDKKKRWKRQEIVHRRRSRSVPKRLRSSMTRCDLADMRAVSDWAQGVPVRRLA